MSFKVFLRFLTWDLERSSEFYRDSIEHGLFGRPGKHELKKYPEKRRTRSGKLITKQIECFHCRSAHKRRQDTTWYCPLCTAATGQPVGFCNNRKRQCFPLFALQEEGLDEDCDGNV